MDLKDIVDDYELNFCNKKCKISTSYKELPTFLVHFEITDLYHLLGIHKLKTQYRATSWIDAVKSNSFILSDYSKHTNFREVIPRISNYNFLYEIFYQFQVKVCVLEKDLVRNTMELSIVFYKDNSKKIVVIGLKKDKTGVFRVATLHETRVNKYKSIRHTMIKSIEWL
ncbi:PBECR4 domain-containing protein [Streptococcus thoraltensis]|uniref:PBECR4 domain-containing protein n=1 Tax=Streptococcus thoraltensis TaxID=55085 RepID=UPI001F5697DE|nr:PBECR4 domain-containing protein [Streptococcus thoraltensis]